MSKTPDSHDMFKKRKGEGNSLLWGLQSSKIIFESLNILKFKEIVESSPLLLFSNVEC
jgi:hypothetical protein